MSNKKQETIEDIVADIRAQNQGLPEDSYSLSPLVCDLLSFADRIEAAAKREREAGAELRKCLKATVGEKCLMCAYIDNEMSAFYGEPVCGNKGCKYKRLRKALR